MEQAALAGTRIVALAGGRSAALAALLLAEIGAEVVHVEPPSGDPERKRSPGAFAVHNRSKMSLALDLEAACGRAALDRLLAAADVLIHDRPAGALGGMLEPDALDERFPHLIASRIGSWPAGHPKAGMPIDDALVLADAGICDEQPAIGRDGPTFIRFPLGEGGAGYLAAIGVAGRLFRRLATGRGGTADTSLIQGALTSMIMLWSRAERPTAGLAGGYRRVVTATQFECSDGLWIHIMTNPDRVPAMAAGLAALDPAEREAAVAAKSLLPNFPNWGANEIVFRTRPRADWLADLWANDVSAQPVLPMGLLYEDEQARINGYVVAVDDPQLGATLQPGSPMQVDPPAAVRNPAPRLDDARETVAGWAPRPALPAARLEPALPLAGLKVLDLGNFLAGPFAPMIMATMGAEVIKLESTGGDQMRYVDWAFTACQRGKRGIALDLKDPRARPALERLVAWADVVHHNLRMPAARKLGLDYETLKAINPDLIYCHVSSYGPIGPRKDWPGFDQMFQASCGWEYEGAGAGNRPTWYRFGMMDHQCAMASLLATLAALIQRRRDGRGRAVAASLLGGGMVSLRETVRLADGALTPYPRLDAGQYGVSPERRLFACADGWIMAVTEAAGAHDRVTAALGAADGDALAAAFASLPAAEAIATVEAAGGHAVVARERQREPFIDDPDNIAAGLIAAYHHPTYGRFEQMGSFIDFGDAATRLDRAPPVLGEHSRAILAEAGFAGDEIAALVAGGTALQAA